MNEKSKPRPAVPAGRDHQAFPKLAEEQLQRMRLFAVEDSFNDGELLFSRGERSLDFFVLLDGCIEIFDFDCDGNGQVFVSHCAGEFTGETDLFSNRKALVSGRAKGTTRVLRFARDSFRQMMSANPDVAETIVRAIIVRRLGILENNLGASYLIGSKNDAMTLRIRRFLRGNGYPTETRFIEDESEADQLLAKYGRTKEDLPLLLCHGEEVLSKPTLLEVGEVVGILERPEPKVVYDLAVIGGGPGGMATAVYAASEGLKTIVLERETPGGQASTSSRIENYLGFPNGLSGQELAGRAQIQSQKFGATLALPMNVVGIDGQTSPYSIRLDGIDDVQARCIVIASGATYRRLGLKNDAHFEGRGLHYAATAIEAGYCENSEIVVVGGGNSAGQAAVFLSGKTEHVHVLIRRDSLTATMSDYLIQRIQASDRITLHTQTEITSLEGNDHLEEVTWTDRETGEQSTRRLRHVFLMIGARPNSEFAGDRISTDRNGFVCTGSSVVEQNRWPLSHRAPELFETSLPGIFAIGDVRSGSVKRVASAVGEGSICVQFVHRVLAALS
ncbi:FAD-dependent oxidoreductase [Planctomycetaceae bacterium SH139]